MLRDFLRRLFPKKEEVREELPSFPKNLEHTVIGFFPYQGYFIEVAHTKDIAPNKLQPIIPLLQDGFEKGVPWDNQLATACMIAGSKVRKLVNEEEKKITFIFFN